jgi:hypothetical protein
MKRTFRNGLFIVMVLLFIACSSEKERLLTGKWTITHTVIGGSPSSFWFKSNGTVIAPWNTDNYAMQSEGIYDFIDDTHIKLTMNKGYYKGNVYMFEIIKLDDKELQLGGTYEILHLIRSAEKE